MFLWTLRNLFGISVCVVMTALSSGFLNIARQRNGSILDIKIIFMEQKEHLLCNWESHEWKHPKIIKGKRLIWLLFWFLWPSFLMRSELNVLSCDRYIYTNAWIAFAVKHNFKIWNDRWINKRLNCVFLYCTCDFMNINICSNIYWMYVIQRLLMTLIPIGGLQP